MQSSNAAQSSGSSVLRPDLFAPSIEVDARGKVNTGKVIIGLTHQRPLPNPRLSKGHMRLQQSLIAHGVPRLADCTTLSARIVGRIVPVPPYVPNPPKTLIGRALRWFSRVVL